MEKKDRTAGPGNLPQDVLHYQPIYQSPSNGLSRRPTLIAVILWNLRSAEGPMPGPCQLVLAVAGDVGSLVEVRRRCWIPVPRDQHQDRR